VIISFYRVPSLPPQTEQGGKPLPLHVGHFICPYRPVPLHKPQANEDVPEPWQSWQMAATATPADIRVAANPINRWRREMFLSDFMVVFRVPSLFAAGREISSWKIGKYLFRLSIH
jgi:hypothetical protein